MGFTYSQLSENNNIQHCIVQNDNQLDNHLEECIIQIDKQLDNIPQNYIAQNDKQLNNSKQSEQLEHKGGIFMLLLANGPPDRTMYDMKSRIQEIHHAIEELNKIDTTILENSKNRLITITDYLINKYDKSKGIGISYYLNVLLDQSIYENNNDAFNYIYILSKDYKDFLIDFHTVESIIDHHKNDMLSLILKDIYHPYIKNHIRTAKEWKNTFALDMLKDLEKNITNM
jgi:hypothetical protein